MTNGIPTNDEWVARDAAVVWHGFTQMDAYADNAPIVVDHTDGRYVVDTDGHRYLDAISSLWVTTLGHHVPELDDAIIGQLRKGAHTTMLGNGNTIVVELSEALARVVPVDDPHFLYASDGASAVEQALKIAFQYWVNRGVTGRTTFLAFGGAYHGDTIGALSLGGGGFGTSIFDPLRFPVRPGARVRRPRLLRRGDPPARAARVRARRRHRGAAGAGRRRHAALRARRPRRARRGHAATTTSCSSATRSPPASAAPAPSSRASSPGSGPTSSASARA